jgi:biotin transport system substrate-specific component
MSLLNAIPRDRSQYRHVASAVLLTLAGMAMLTLSARVVLPIPGSPVPVTAQTLAVLVIGALLPWQLALSSVTSYLLAGLAGLPVFAMGGGAAYLLGPTGGFLLGFVPAAVIASRLIHHAPAGRGGLIRIVLALLLADAVLFAFGMAQLAAFGMPAGKVVQIALLPFIPGELVKIGLSAAALRLTRQNIVRKERT